MAFGVHHRRVSRRCFEHVQSRDRVDAAGARQRESFGEHGPVEAEHEVDDQLESSAAACGANVEAAVAPTRQHWRCVAHIVVRAANDQHGIATPHLLARASDCGVDVADATRCQPLSEGLSGLRIARRGVDDQFTRR